MSGAPMFALIALLALLPLAIWVTGGLRRGPRFVAIALAIAGIGGLYLLVGTPAQISPPPDPMADLVTRIEARLDADPMDVEGWRMLGRLRIAQGRFALATDAYAKARALTNDGDPQALIGFAESRLMQDPDLLTGELAPLLERALELAPDDQRALWYGGHLANERGDRALAEQRWRKLLAQDLPPDLRHAVEMLIGAPALEAAPLFELEIAVAPALAAKVPAGASLFVFVREGDGRMPLLARRMDAAGLPRAVTLGAGDLLGGPEALERAKTLTAGARISASGRASRGPGDLEGVVRIERGAPGRARVVIDTVVP